jgi:predicted DNA-binding ribbon-helix-helix protein
VTGNKHSVAVFGRETSISLEKEFWTVLREMCTAEGATVSAMVERIADARLHRNLSSSIRVAVLLWVLGGGRVG